MSLQRSAPRSRQLLRQLYIAQSSPCTPEELQRPVTVAQVNTQLNLRASRAEATVRRHVPDHQLTQERFDSLVSFVYNTGATGALPTLRAANRGDAPGVVGQINQNVYVHPRDARGRRLAPVRVPGLVNRRRE
ncbi:glycoside hydrolase family protein [Collimonas pratensis]|nr:glycoside hydrolase family protein [Collimonas pratensis]